MVHSIDWPMGGEREECLYQPGWGGVVYSASSPIYQVGSWRLTHSVGLIFCITVDELRQFYGNWIGLHVVTHSEITVLGLWIKRRHHIITQQIRLRLLKIKQNLSKPQIRPGLIKIKSVSKIACLPNSINKSDMPRPTRNKIKTSQNHNYI